MPRIPGYYEYDDDKLTPSKKKEGGLHQNLFNDEGVLKGHARFIPKEEPDAPPEPTVVHETIFVNETVYVQETVYVEETVFVNETVYVQDAEYERQQAAELEEEKRRQALEAEERAELIANIVKLLFTTATPYAKRFWNEKVRPTVEARRAKKADGRPSKTKKGAAEPIVVDAVVFNSGQELAEAKRMYRQDMTSAEAQARYLAALAARAFSDKQMNLLSNARIVEGDSLTQLQHTLAELPPPQVEGVIKAVEENPTVLTGDLLDELGILLGFARVAPEPVPVKKRLGRR
jgi:hypothetical protein